MSINKLSVSSAELESWTSRSLSEPSTDWNDKNLTSLKRKTKSSHSVAGEAGPSKNDKYYEEVDVRMSRNSFDYPSDHKYVEDWLDNSDECSDLTTDLQDDRFHKLGNVIGIRGFKQDSKFGPTSEMRSTYKKLRYNHFKLLTDHKRLSTKLNALRRDYRKLLKRRDYDLQVLDALRNQQRTWQKLEIGGHSPVKQHQAGQARQSDAIDNLLNENASLRKQLAQQAKDNQDELDRLRQEIKSISQEPDKKLLTSLKNDNFRLKKVHEQDVSDLDSLRRDYYELEVQLQSLMRDQGKDESTKNEGTSRLMVELCRLQVYQPKLEMLLNTEREIRLELQKKMDILQEENDDLKNQIEQSNIDLRTQNLRTKKDANVVLDKLQAEVERWQSKFEALAKEKSDSDELLKIFKLKLSQADCRHQAAMDNLKENHQMDIGSLRDTKLELEKNRARLTAQLDIAQSKLDEVEAEKLKLMSDFIGVNVKLEEVLAKQMPQEVLMSRMKSKEDQLDLLMEQLNSSDAKNKLLQDDVEQYRAKLAQNETQMQKLRVTLDNLKAEKDLELAKLRAGLNLEKYNRQVALKGIERELKSSLSELDTIRSGFSRGTSKSASPAGKTRQLGKTSSQPESGPQMASNDLIY